MTENQWPRFVVFLQAQANTPQQYVGSVHAPDITLAQANARDVFVRQPQCVSLWIVPADAVLTFTRAALPQEEAWYNLPAGEQPDHWYHIFQKHVERGPFVYTGDVQAATSESALKLALTSAKDRAALETWVVPADQLARISAEEIAALFASLSAKGPARD
ncbi:MAG TPA: hypothetical protein VHO69_14985 [Phototrophicaceae bacterium]|nr:hypothetical protein [Phototrophicaceae bacterium]